MPAIGINDYAEFVAKDHQLRSRLARTFKKDFIQTTREERCNMRQSTASPMKRIQFAATMLVLLLVTRLTTQAQLGLPLLTAPSWTIAAYLKR